MIPIFGLVFVCEFYREIRLQKWRFSEDLSHRSEQSGKTEAAVKKGETC